MALNMKITKTLNRILKLLDAMEAMEDYMKSQEKHREIEPGSIQDIRDEIAALKKEEADADEGRRR